MVLDPLGGSFVCIALVIFLEGQCDNVPVLQYPRMLTCELNEGSCRAFLLSRLVMKNLTVATLRRQIALKL